MHSNPLRAAPCQVTGPTWRTFAEGQGTLHIAQLQLGMWSGCVQAVTTFFRRVKLLMGCLIA